jgi:hypothetical protein
LGDYCIPNFILILLKSFQRVHKINTKWEGNTNQLCYMLSPSNLMHMKSDIQSKCNIGYFTVFKLDFNEFLKKKKKCSMYKKLTHNS